MSERNFKTGFLTKVLSITVVVAFYFVPVSYGRDGMKLYSIGTNAAWSVSTSWSLTPNGTFAGLVPQDNDTIIINNTVIQNIDFTFSGNGYLQVSGNGLLRGDNQSLSFTGNSTLRCGGEMRLNKLSFSGNSTLLTESNSKIVVKNSFVANAAANQVVSGKLSVMGVLSVGSALNVSGNGVIESGQFDGSGSVMGITPASLIPGGSLIAEYNWIGTLNTNWNDPMNWAGSVVPGINSNVAVLSSLHNPDITGNAYSNNLYVNSGSSITVYPNAKIEINGNLSVLGAGKFLLKNTVTEKSSLFLNGDATGKIQSEYPVVKGQKNLISTPVEMASSGTFLNMYLRTYDESSSQWGVYIVPTNDPLQVMQGYELYSPDYNDTRIFEGTPVNDTKSYTISNAGNGLNLTGNPFTCFIDWENNDNKAWERSSIASAIYYPDPSGSGNLAVYLPGGNDAVSLNNGSRYIAPMQGFFVKAGKQGSLTVNQNSRVSNFSASKSVLKNNGVKFKLSDSKGLTDEVLFRVIENATFSFDDNLDALKISGNTNSPSLYLTSDDDTRYAVNTIPSVNSSLEMPLNIQCVTAGQYSISTLGASDFEFRTPMILEDKQLNTFIDLRADSVYSFYHSPAMNPNRFVIHFNSTSAVNEQSTTPTETIITHGQVIINGNDNGVYSAKLFTIEGKLISTSKGTLSEGINLSTGNRAPEICILQLSDGKHTTIKKVYTK